MKSTLFLILFSLCFSASAQKLKCCNSQEQIKSVLEGSWRLKHVTHITNFEYSLSEGKQQCEIKQEFTEDSKVYKVINHLTNYKILEDEVGFILDWDSGLFHWDARILKLKPNKMILKINGSNLEFKRNKTKG